MKKLLSFAAAVILLLQGATVSVAGFTVDHTSTDLSDIPEEWITKAKEDLHIAYNHTSHGSQLITGMNALKQFPDFGNKYSWTDSSTGNTSTLSLDDKGITGAVSDLGGDGANSNGIAKWAEDTYTFLESSNNFHINVIMWSWCNIGGHDIPRYLRSMEWLIGQFSSGGSHARATDHPVQFVYITAHANGGGLNDSADRENKKIRAHCSTNDCILFDFSDIENYDPDGNYYLDKDLDDALYYDGSGSHDRNWASEYLSRHDDSELDRLTTGTNVSGYSGVGSCAHSPGDGETSDARLNCTLKGRAAWHLFARLAGWNPDTPVPPNPTPNSNAAVTSISTFLLSGY